MGFTCPEHAPDIPQFTIVDMFIIATDPSQKYEIMQLFKSYQAI